jgi:hypothetical protein
MSKIFESPDGGASIYERAMGDMKRVLINENNKLHEEMREAAMWGEIRRMAKTNPAMREYTNRCIELYHLLKENK